MLENAMLDDARFDQVQRELLAATDALLTAIATGDAATYASLCVPELSCFEDVCPYRIDGVAFHLHLVERGAARPRPARTDILTPRVQVYGDTGIVTYTRLITHDDAATEREASRTPGAPADDREASRAPGRPVSALSSQPSAALSAGLRWETYNETRVFVKQAGAWRMAHFHRSRT